ncbi:MAG: GDP-mannose 4,6-dehydratase [Deltaproteobacteria bacterium]|nr:GDP-mannose 4,6-dehydratase [Deltaproteobacteria bacterium]
MDVSVDPSTFWRDRRVLITGATGLVGGWLLRRLLDAGADVVCLVRDHAPKSLSATEGLLARSSVVRGDVCDQALLERALGEYEVATVFHLAAQTIVPIANRNPISTFETNVAGTWRLLEACRRSPLVKQIVVASSDKAYGPQAQLPYVEDAPLAGEHPYDVSKSAADLIARSYAVTFGLPVVVTRCGNFYGGGDLNWNRVVPGTIRSVLRGERPVIRSDGTLVRDYFYVEDGAIAYMCIAEALAKDPALKGEAFNFSAGARLSALEVVQRVLAAMGSTLQPDIRNEASHEIAAQWLDSTKARARLGWQPEFTLEASLERTVAWYRQLLGAAS